MIPGWSASWSPRAVASDLDLAPRVRTHPAVFPEARTHSLMAATHVAIRNVKRKSALTAVSDGGTTRLETFLDVACPYTPVFTLFFSIALLFALVSLLVVATQPATSEAFVVSLLTIVVDGFIIASTGPVLYLCREYRFE